MPCSAIIAVMFPYASDFHKCNLPCPITLWEDGYPDVQAFMATYRKAEAVVDKYNRDLAEWERQVKEMSGPSAPPP